MTPSFVRRAAATVLLTLLTVLLIPARASASPAPTGVWPLAPRPPVVRGFEPPPERWLPGHRGADLLGSPGQQVRAAATGTITYAGSLAGRGVVVVNHGLVRTTYEPVVPSVQVGAQVAAGSVIGTLSAGGSHCPPRACLHWGLLRGDVYLDPLSMLTAAPVRLLPLAADRPPGLADGPVTSTGRPAAAPTDQTGAQADDAEPQARSSFAGSLIVGLAAVLTVAAGLLIRRH